MAGFIFAGVLLFFGVVMSLPTSEVWIRPPEGGPPFGELAYKAQKDPPLKGKGRTLVSLSKGITVTQGEDPAAFELVAENTVIPTLQYDKAAKNLPGEATVELSHKEEVKLLASGVMYSEGMEPADRRFHFFRPGSSKELLESELAELGVRMVDWETRVKSGQLFAAAIFEGPFQQCRGLRPYSPDTYWEWELNGVEPISDTRVIAYAGDYRWYDGPIEFVWDMAHGPTEIRESPIEPGAEMDFGSCMVKVVASAPGMYMMEPVRTATSGKYAVAHKSKQMGPQGTTVFLTSDSPQLWRSMECSLLNKDGESIGEASFGWPDQERIACVFTSSAPEEIAGIQVRYWPALDRVFYSLPKLAGLPEANQAPANLFDLRIPYLELHSARDFAETLSGGTQLQVEMDYGNLDLPGYYPQTYKDVSLRTLMDEAQSINQGRRLVVDLNQYTIRETRRPRWLEALFGGLSRVGDLLTP